MSRSSVKQRVLIMTPDREFAAQFLDLCAQYGHNTMVSACVSVSATMMLSSHYGPRMLLADIRYGEVVLRQMIRELKHENPHLVVLLVGESACDLNSFARKVRANGWLSRERADCHRLVRLLDVRPVEPKVPLLPWTMPPFQPSQVYS